MHRYLDVKLVYLIIDREIVPPFSFLEPTLFRVFKQHSTLVLLFGRSIKRSQRKNMRLYRKAVLLEINCKLLLHKYKLYISK